jgi:hypothetical protein
MIKSVYNVHLCDGEQFWPKTHVLSMVARINQMSALSTTYMAILRGGAINDDMVSADNPTSLAQTP